MRCLMTAHQQQQTSAVNSKTSHNKQQPRYFKELSSGVEHMLQQERSRSAWSSKGGQFTLSTQETEPIGLPTSNQPGRPNTTTVAAQSGKARSPILQTDHKNLSKILLERPHEYEVMVRGHAVEGLHGHRAQRISIGSCHRGLVWKRSSAGISRQISHAIGGDDEKTARSNGDERAIESNDFNRVHL